MGDHRKSLGNAGPTRIRPKQRKKIYRTLKQLYGDRCYYCTRPFDGNLTRTLDHLFPLCRGGTHEICNLVLSCAKCNRTKGDLTWWEYFQTEMYHKRRTNGFRAQPERPPRSAIEVIRSLRFWEKQQ